MTAPTFRYIDALNVVEISQGGDQIVFVGASHAVEAIATLMKINVSAPTSASSEPRAAGNPENRIGNGDLADATREGAEVHFLDNRRHSVHADRYACHPDETGGAA